MRIYQVVVGAVVLGTLAPIALHVQTHGALNVHQAGLAFFLWLNAIIAAWEICLFLRIDLIESQYARFKTEYAGRELDRVKDFFSSKVSVAEVFSPSTWAQIWSSYAVFDESYANRKSFGFFIDVGNGFSTLIPTLLFLYGMTFELMPARILGFVGLLICYQMWYGTVVYLGSFILNKRYRGHSALNIALFVGLSNGIWLFFPLWGMWAAVELIVSQSYGVFR